MNSSIPILSDKEREARAQAVGADSLLLTLRRMLLIRTFEKRGEAAYQQGLIGGFYHAYSGQEAIQTAAVDVFGPRNWWITTYRCHALALLLGATTDSLMAELYGKETGNAKGRGGSMHLFTERMLGGFGIVGGHIPLATGAGFSLKAQGIDDEFAICFLGDGAVAQGAFHEGVNLAALWDLPCLFVIENNQWGMGTHVDRALSVKRLAEEKAPSYGIEGLTIDGMDYFACMEGFKEAREKLRTQKRPLLVECITERFRGHSISDPGLYRTKEALAKCMERDPIILLRKLLDTLGWLDEEGYQELASSCKQEVVGAMNFAKESPWPSLATLEKDVFAGDEEGAWHK